MDGRSQELNPGNAGKLLTGSGLVIDAFDNSQSRQAVKDFCLQSQMQCLHIGLTADYAEIIWNQFYRVPSPINDDVCDYPLARNLVMFTVAVASTGRRK